MLPLQYFLNMIDYLSLSIIDVVQYNEFGNGSSYDDICDNDYINDISSSSLPLTPSRI